MAFGERSAALGKEFESFLKKSLKTLKKKEQVTILNLEIPSFFSITIFVTIPLFLVSSDPRDVSFEGFRRRS